MLKIRFSKHRKSWILEFQPGGPPEHEEMEESASHHLFTTLDYPEDLLRCPGCHKMIFRKIPSGQPGTPKMINFKSLSTTDNKDISNPEAHHLKLHYMIEFSEMYHFGKSRIRAASELKCWKSDLRNTENVEFWNFSPEGHQSRGKWRRVLRTTYLTPKTF